MIPYGQQWIDDDDVQAVNDVLKSVWLTTGPKITEFENTLCEYIGCRYAVAVNSGTSALDIAVKSLDLPENSEVITTPFTFVATSNSLLYNNLTPVFADIRKDTRNINPDDIEKRITSKTKAVIYVDYAGQPCEIEKIQEIANKYNLWLIEDASHAFGAEYKEKKVGNFADLTIFSFHPVKPITTGEGGAVVTNDSKLADKMKKLRNHGIDKDVSKRYGPDAGWVYDMKMLGKNYRMTEIQAALGISQLNKLDSFISRRNEIAKLYNKYLNDLDIIELPCIKKNIKHGWHIYTILLNGTNRDEFFKYMRKNNIGVNVHYIPIYQFTYYDNNFNIDSTEYPNTENVFNRIITLPIYPKMTNKDVNIVINTIKNWLL